MKITNVKIDHHRNGVTGVGFHVAVFDTCEGKDARRMLGVIFPEPGEVAVFDLAKLAAEDIDFGSNSWRGDSYEDVLRRAVKAYEDAPLGIGAINVTLR